MKRLFMQGALMLATIAVSGSGAFAQKYELHPYVGGMFLTDFRAAPDQVGRFDFKNPGVFGIKGGGFLTQDFMLEGNVGYVNQFEFRHNLDPKVYAIQWEALGSYNFFPARFAGAYPYVSAGIGGLTLKARNQMDFDDSDTVVYPVQVEPRQNGGPFPTTIVPFTIQDNDTFFTFSYGGGVKGQRLWGPLGLRADFRGRTMPNFYQHRAVHAFEMTGGVLVSWGER